MGTAVRPAISTCRAPSARCADSGRSRASPGLKNAPSALSPPAATLMTSVSVGATTVRVPLILPTPLAGAHHQHHERAPCPQLGPRSRVCPSRREKSPLFWSVITVDRRAARDEVAVLSSASDPRTKQPGNVRAIPPVTTTERGERPESGRLLFPAAPTDRTEASCAWLLAHAVCRHDPGKCRKATRTGGDQS